MLPVLRVIFYRLLDQAVTKLSETYVEIRHLVTVLLDLLGVQFYETFGVLVNNALSASCVCVCVCVDADVCLHGTNNRVN